VTRARGLKLSDGVAEALVVPELGASLASYDLIEAGRRTPIFRPCRDLDNAGPFDLASNLLVPWSNRISGGGFRFGTKFHALQPNLVGEPYPIHGNGFMSAWTVDTARAAQAELSLASAGPGPFRYFARAAYELMAGALTMRASVVNRADEPLPFGLGFHPWIVRTHGAFLKAVAETVVPETSNHLPAGAEPLSARRQWDFRTLRELPAGWLNNCFLGWDGHAEIVWRDRKLKLEIAADLPLRVYIVYSPSAAADFFCFEPVTHAVDAHNLPGGPEANGLAILAPGSTLTISCRFAPRRFD
jgi:aldose 1-epimerase